MSKNSPKQRLEQLKDWLAWKKANGGASFLKSKAPKKRFSKSDYYKKTRERYGYQSN